MYLHCCHRRLTVHVASDLRDAEGYPADGLFRPDTMQIFLYRGLARDRRREVLAHEFGHAFEELVGRIDPEDHEGRQNRLATMEAQFSGSLEEQGGEAAIHALFGDDDGGDIVDAPGELATVVDESAAEWPTRISCPSCHQSHSSDRVRNGTPSFNPRLNCFVLWRMLICNECGRELRWQQRCTHEGMPLPDVVVPPSVRMVGIG